MTKVHLVAPPADAPSVFLDQVPALATMLRRVGYEAVVDDGLGAQAGEIVAHLWPHPELLRAAPDAVHVETSLGHSHPWFGAFRIYASRAWQAFHFGMTTPGAGRPVENPAYSFVVPLAFDEHAWTPSSISGDYMLYAGRLNPDKGLYVLRELLQALPDMRLVVAGPGNVEFFLGELGAPDRVEYRGIVAGAERDALYGGAAVMLCPTQYIEPFGASAVEAMMCGTPVVASDWGGFVETVIPGVTGYRARTLRDWVIGIEAAVDLDREEVAAAARERFGYRAVGPMYDGVFRQLLELYSEGWRALGRRAQVPVP